MLKAIDSRICKKTEIEFGDYLPFKFWHQPQANGTSVYWRTGDLNLTLLEVEIERESGQIIGVSLLLPGKVSRNLPELRFINVDKLEGYPIVSLNEWPKGDINDDPGTLQVFANSNRLLIALSFSLVVAKTIVADDITFGVDNNDSIIWILVNNLSQENLTTLINL